MSAVNKTVIALIPKVEELVRMKQVRPISLSIVIYKIVSKTLLNRMKPYLHLCISKNQSAFLKGRLISDNILIAHELIHYLSSSKNGPNKWAALKLDMEKAFDRVKWTFLRSVMLRMSFHPNWVSLIMECVSTVTFSARVNGKLTGEFTPQRGLHQGDPLSPFLFLICMQGLSAALSTEQEAGRIKGIHASQQGPRINHLFYADDSIVFVWNFVHKVSRLKEVLNIFTTSSGQRINFDKSTIFFSPNTSTAHRRKISSVLGISEVFDPDIYLGVPLKIGKNKTDTFGFVNEMVDKRIDGWTKRLLSFGGREIFLKSVAQALPQYIMSCYLLPRTVTNRITSSMRKFWWTGKTNKQGWPLMAWDRICSPKNVGGLGLRDLRCFNLALLRKQLWRFLTRPDSLVAKLFRAKYFSTGRLLDSRLKDHASFAWKGLHATLQELRSGFSWAPTVSDPWCISSICHRFCTAFLTVAGPELVLSSWAVVFCASIETGSFALLGPRLGIFGRRFSTVQGLGSWFLGADGLPFTMPLRRPSWAAHGRAWWPWILPDSLERLSVVNPNASVVKPNVGNRATQLRKGGSDPRADSSIEFDPKGCRSELSPSWIRRASWFCNLDRVVWAQPACDLLGYLRLWFLRASPNWVVYNSLIDCCWSWRLLVPHSAGWGWPDPSKFSPGLHFLFLNWVSFSWVGTPLSWALSSPAWPFPSPTQLETKFGHFLFVWRLAQACFHVRPDSHLQGLDTHLHDTLLYLPGRSFGLSSLISCIPSYLFLSMDSELLHSMENLQFTEEESGSVVMESPCDEGESSLWLVGSVVTNKTVNVDSVCRIFRSVWKSMHVSEILELRPNFFLIKPVGKESKDMILKRRPWVVHDDLFSIELYNPTWRAVDFNFNNMVIWVRVYQLPLRAMNGAMGL
ncbi:hypothetical protein GQ457_17G013380 [Hibiscus cannabinus]